MILLVFLGPIGFGVAFAVAVLNIPALAPLRERLLGRSTAEYNPMADPVYRSALDALETAAVVAPGPAVSFELYVAPGELPGVTEIMGVPVMHSRAADPGRPFVFDRLSMRYVGR